MSNVFVCICRSFLPLSVVLMGLCLSAPAGSSLSFIARLAYDDACHELGRQVVDNDAIEDGTDTGNAEVLVAGDWLDFAPFYRFAGKRSQFAGQRGMEQGQRKLRNIYPCFLFTKKGK